MASFGGFGEPIVVLFEFLELLIHQFSNVVLSSLQLSNLKHDLVCVRHIVDGLVDVGQVLDDEFEQILHLVELQAIKRDDSLDRGCL